MSATDIVAYVYKAEVLCPECIVPALAGGTTFPDAETTEEILNNLAAYCFPGVDRENEKSFDSDVFPKVIFESEIEENEKCGTCGKAIVE